MLKLLLLLLPLLLTTNSNVKGQMEEDGEEKNSFGLLIGKFNVYHHGVGGAVYAVNSTTLLVKNFHYDGQGKDAYFWGGTSGTGPGPNGFIIPDQWGRTNVLQKSDNKDFTLTLPDKKKISELKWLSVYDLSRLENFGDVYIPDGFEPPGVVQLPSFISKTDDCASEDIELVDMKTMRIIKFYLLAYMDQEIYFSVGKGHVPTLRPGAGWTIPDQNGYLEPLRTYKNEDILLTLPGELTFGDLSVHWLAVYDKRNDKALCYVNIPSDHNIPPSLTKVIKYQYSLPNCEPLHNDFHVAWEVVGQTITIELVALAGDDDWLGFGLSGSENKTQMIGSDVAIGYLNLKTGQGVVQDVNIDAKAPCVSVLDKKRGVCLDSDLGAADGIQVLEGRRVGPLTVIKYRRQITKAEQTDKDFLVDKPVGVIWALGRLMSANGEPGFHRLYPKYLKKIQFLKPVKSSSQEGDGEEDQDQPICRPFLLTQPEMKIKPWSGVKIVDGKLRSFSARLGPAAGQRGSEGITGQANPGYAWYIQGYLAPELYLQRGLSYSFKVEGGNNPHNVETYHPFIISSEMTPRGHVKGQPWGEGTLAGIEHTRRGKPRPTAAGRLCAWANDRRDRRLDDEWASFEKFRNSLKLRCENTSEPAILEITPNSSWPDIVYYHSHTQPNMGWKIHVLDQVSEDALVSTATTTTPTTSHFYTLGAFVLFFITLF